MDSSDFKRAKDLTKRGRYHEVITLLEPIAETIDLSSALGEREQKVFGMLGNAYAKTNKPDIAIAKLRPLHDSGHGNIVTTNILGNAYIQIGQAGEAIRILRPLHNSDQRNDYTISILGNAYVHAQDEKGFETIKGQIRPADFRDYLEAKLWYLKKDEHGNNSYTRKALSILTPYVVNATKVHHLPFNILQIYMAYLGDDSPVMEHLRASVGERSFAKLMKLRDTWREDPLRAERENVHMSSTQRFFEEGGIAVSGQAASFAGIKGPVSVKGPNTTGNVFSGKPKPKI